MKWSLRNILQQSSVAVLGLTLGLTGCRTPELPTVNPDKYEGRTIKVACIGDSITAGAGIDQPEKNSYPARLSDYLGSSYDVKNFGRSGATLQKSGDLSYWTTSEFAAADAFQPDVVILMLGTNDTKPQNWKDSARFAKDFNDLLEHYRALKSRPKVRVCTPVPVYRTNWGINEDTLETGVIPALMDVCSRQKIPVIDLNDTLTGHPEMVPDGVHPNAAGAELMARTIVDAISLRGINRGQRREVIYPGQEIQDRR
jgi:lysophospholipase L1-like esterase